MRITTLALAPAFLLAAMVGIGATRGAAAAQAAQAPTAENYVWAGACKSCHQDIYDAWAKTKHAKALSRLSSGDQQKECIGCHVTGPKKRVEEHGSVLNGGIQCEGCHGASAAHAKDPKVHTTFGKTPPESVCTDCHNDKSPHFRGFFYQPMLAFSHHVGK